MALTRAEIQRNYRKRQSATIDTSQKFERLLDSLQMAAHTAEQAKRLPVGVYVEGTPVATAQNLIDWLNGQLKLLNVENNKPASKRKRV